MFPTFIRILALHLRHSKPGTKGIQGVHLFDQQNLSAFKSIKGFLLPENEVYSKVMLPQASVISSVLGGAGGWLPSQASQVTWHDQGWSASWGSAWGGGLGVLGRPP